LALKVVRQLFVMERELFAQIGLSSAEAEPIGDATQQAHDRRHESGEPEDRVNRADHSLELCLLRHELLSAGGGQRVKASAAIVLRRAPLGADRAVEQSLQRWIREL
jgi:hypothetical protein